jgi:hypothetical protein
MKIFWVAAICLLMAGCGTSQKRSPRVAQRRAAPKRTVISPIGGYVATAESPNRKSPERDILITRPGEKQPIIKFPFTRRVDVVWAPDESGVAVVDLVLQNETRVVVFELPSGRPLYELRREAICELNPDLPCGAAYSHVFFSNVVWLAPDRIQVDVDMLNPLEANLPARAHGQVVASFVRGQAPFPR